MKNFELLKISYIIELLIINLRFINLHHNQNEFNLNIYKILRNLKLFFVND